MMRIAIVMEVVDIIVIVVDMIVSVKIVIMKSVFDYAVY